MSDISLDRWIEIKSVVQEALELPRVDRASLLSKACGEDQELRKEVEAYLAVSETQAQHFDGIRIVPHTFSSLPAGAQIGPYTIESLLGEGGMGAVYLARDEKHDRPVALKLVSGGKAHAEPQLMAQLSHPNIATLYDSGETDEGLSYFAMEYVNGVTLTKYCEENELALQNRLKLYCAVCRAVAYAHRNLIVHRDLTPNNILVTADGTPKLLDFGIAKQIESDRTMTATQPGLRAMTVAFSSPEHIAGGRVATTSDIYSLGVLLSLMLTGRLPYQVPRQKLLEAVQAGEVSAPSTVYASAAEDGLGGEFAVAEQGQSLKKALQGDLDAITLKALRREPDKRYESVGELVEDVRRHMANEPVSAHIGSVRYRLGKFMRRHRSVLGALVLFLALMAAFVGILLKERAQTSRERDRAATAATFLTSVFEGADPRTVGTTEEPTARDLLEAGVERLDRELEGQPELQADLLKTIGVAYRNIGDYERAEELLIRAEALHTSLTPAQGIAVADDKYELCQVFMVKGDQERAEQYCREALSLYSQSIGEDNERSAATINILGLVLTYQGRFAEAEEFLLKGLETKVAHLGPNHVEVTSSYNNLGALYRRLGKYDQALPMYEKAVELCKRIHGTNHPDLASALSGLALIYSNLGKYGDAEPLARESLAIRRSRLGEQHADTTAAMDTLAQVLRFLGNLEEAEQLLRSALEIRRNSLGEKHEYFTYSLNNLAGLLLLLSQIP